MEKSNLTPEKITKPIQLLGAWLVGLLAIDGAFLTAAINMSLSSWQSGALTIAAIMNVPIFIVALFLLQTKFRPELQEDSYYSTYLNNRTNEIMTVSKSEVMYDQLLSRISGLEAKLAAAQHTSPDIQLAKLSYGVNGSLDDATEKRVIEKLDELGVEVIRMFGEENVKPKDLVVAVATHLPKNIENKILLMAKGLGFEHYAYIEPFEEIEEDVLFGAYGNPDGKIAVGGS